MTPTFNLFPRLKAIPLTELKVGMCVCDHGLVVDIEKRKRSPDPGWAHRPNTNPLSRLAAYITYESGERLSYSMRERIVLELR